MSFTQNKQKNETKLKGSNELLDKYYNMVKEVTQSDVYYQWQMEAEKAEKYYHGRQDEIAEQQKVFERLGQKFISTNKIAQYVNFMVGREMRSKKKIGFESQNKSEWVTKTVTALNAQSIIVQEDTDYTFKNSQNFKNGLIYGLTSAAFKYNELTQNYYYTVDDPFTCVYDFFDKTKDMSNQKFFAKVSYVDLDELEILFPKHKNQLRKMSEKYIDIYSRNDRSQIIDGWDEWCFGNKHYREFKILEIQYKDILPMYEGKVKHSHYAVIKEDEADYEVLEEEHVFKTFSLEEAKKLSEGGDFLVKKGKAIKKALICGDLVLSDDFLEPFIPDRKDFSHVPFVLYRDPKTGVPYGWYRDVYPLLDAYNLAYTTALKNLDKTTLVINESALRMNSLNEIKSELMSKVGVIIVGEGEQPPIKIDRHNNDFNNPFVIMENAEKQLQGQLGLVNDEMGRNSNAQSKIAIDTRAYRGEVNGVPILAIQRSVQRREGTVLCDILQNNKDLIFECDLSNGERGELMNLNKRMTDIDGKEIILNNTKFLPIGVCPEQIDDYLSALQMDRDKQREALQNPQLLQFYSNPVWWKVQGAVDPYSVANDFKKILEEHEKKKAAEQEQQAQMIAAQQQQQNEENPSQNKQQ